ncbi:MAG: tetratricopeptide repeat protein [bacterium]
MNKILIILVCITANIAANDSIGNFADQLFDQQNYLDASVEYERLIFFDSLRRNFSIKLKLSRCYFELDSYENSMKILEELAGTAGDTGTSARILAGEIDIKQGHYDNAVSRLKNIDMGKALLISGYAYFRLGKIEEAKASFQGIYENDSLYNRSQRLSEFLDKKVKLKDKNYCIAGILSLMPGLGHLYTGRKGDGLFSLALVSAFGSIGYFYHQRESYVRSSSMFTISGLFYAGSIYGALMGVKIYNRDRKIKYHEDFDAIYSSD